MEAQEIQQKELHTMRGELVLLVAVLINSFGVVLMLHSGAGISAISSVPFAFSEVFTRISLGTWTYLFQGVLVLSLMILRKRFVPQYLFSFVVGFVFGELLDVHGVDQSSAAYASEPYSLFCNQLSVDLHRNCTVKPLWSADHTDRSVPEGTGGHYGCRVFQHKGLV